jgi:hypothetical protein
MADDELTDAAKAEIRDAIRIVREDRFERYARERLEKWEPKTPQPTPEPTPTPTPPTPEPGPTPPPPNPEPAPESKPKKRGLWWADAEDE